MANHYEIHLIHPIQTEGDTLPEWATTRTLLHFEVGADGWTMEEKMERAMGFSKADTNIVVPSHNMALVEVWED